MATRGTRASTREQLIEGAKKAVSRHGLGDATVERIVKAASLSRRTFYQYFRDVDDVMVAVYDQEVGDLVDQVRTAIAEAPQPLHSVSTGVDAYLDFQQSGGRLVAELQAVAVNPASPLWHRRERVLDELVDIVDAEVQRVSGLRMEPLVYRGIFLAMEGLVIHMRRGGPFAPDSRQRVAEIVKPMFVAVLLGHEHMPKA